jgi:hypothetical protein
MSKAKALQKTVTIVITRKNTPDMVPMDRLPGSVIVNPPKAPPLVSLYETLVATSPPRPESLINPSLHIPHVPLPPSLSLLLLGTMNESHSSESPLSDGRETREPEYLAAWCIGPFSS